MEPEVRPGDFEKLVVWQKGAALFELIHAATSHGVFRTDYPFRNQLRAAVLSIPSNIAEGFGRYSNREFLRFLSIANGSTYEVRSQVGIAQRVNYLKAEEAHRIIEQCLEVSRMIEGLRKSIVRKTVGL